MLSSSVSRTLILQLAFHPKRPFPEGPARSTTPEHGESGFRGLYQQLSAHAIYVRETTLTPNLYLLHTPNPLQDLQSHFSNGSHPDTSNQELHSSRSHVVHILRRCSLNSGSPLPHYEARETSAAGTLHLPAKARW